MHDTKKFIVQNALWTLFEKPEKEKKGAKLAQLVALVKFAFMISRSHN